MGEEAQGLWGCEILDVSSCLQRPQTMMGMMRWVASLCDPNIPNHLCITCDAVFSPVAVASMPAAFVFLCPAAITASTAMVSGVCPRCAARPDLTDAVMAAYREGLFSGDLRPLAPAHFAGDGGRA